MAFLPLHIHSEKNVFSTKFVVQTLLFSTRKTIGWMRSRQNGLIAFDIFSKTFASLIIATEEKTT